MNSLWRLLVLCCLGASVQAQTHWGPSNETANTVVPPTTALPLRNLHIEVRQIDQSTAANESIDATVALEARPGQSRVGLGIDARRDQTQRSDQVQQQVLVLNGRRAAIVLRNASPLRLRQMTRRQGVWVNAPGLVWIDQDTGFDAQARWDGGDTVELELTALQHRTMPGSTAAASTFMLAPLGEWITVAQSELDDSSQQDRLTGRGARASQSRLSIQVRVNLR
jgi:hypothetical protein